MKNVEIGFETSVFHTKDKTTRQLLLYFRQQLKKKEQKVKVTISTSRQKNFNTTSSKQLRHTYIYSAECFVSIQVVEFPTTSGGKKYDHLVGGSASGQKSDHLVGNLTTSCCQNKK